MWKEHNIFAHLILSNGIGFNKDNMLETNSMMELILETNDVRKGDIHLMKETEYTINSFPVA